MTVVARHDRTEEALVDGVGGDEKPGWIGGPLPIDVASGVVPWNHEPALVPQLDERVLVGGFEAADHTRYFASMHGDPWFDSVDIEAKREGGQIKWSSQGPDVLGAWVAEHDFDRPPEIAAALHRVADLGAWGYCNTGPQVTRAFSKWAADRHGWTVDPDLVTLTVDSLQAVWAGTAMFSEPDDGVIITPPIYFPFHWIADTLGRAQLDWNMRRNANGEWDLELNDLRSLLARSPRATVLVLCHPHNPTGRVMSEEWLRELVMICAEHDVSIVSDEIHADLVYPDREFTPILTVPGAAERTLVATSTGKTFATSGLRCAVAVAGDPAVKARWDDTFGGLLLGRPNRPGMEAALAAWTHGGEWADRLVAYLDGNRRHLASRLRDEAPAVRFAVPEATYLMWLDVSACGLGDAPADVLLAASRVSLSNGPIFGTAGAGHVRLNFGTSLTVLDRMLDRMIPHLEP
jgi:cysteine-S-conjugate beta-lyase